MASVTKRLELTQANQRDNPARNGSAGQPAGQPPGQPAGQPGTEARACGRGPHFTGPAGALATGDSSPLARPRSFASPRPLARMNETKRLPGWLPPNLQFSIYLAILVKTYEI